MKKFLIIITLLTVPFLASAESKDLVTSYSQVMTERLSFGLNRNARLYNGLVRQSERLQKEGKNLTEINKDLAEAKLIINRGQTHLAELPVRATSLTASSTQKESYKIVRQLVKEIIVDIRLSYAKIKEIKLLIKKY